jgi:hypothetical protein
MGIKKEIVKVFGDLINNYKRHGCITKTCYCLNIKHINFLLKMEKDLKKDKNK